MAAPQNELSPQFARLFFVAGLLEKTAGETHASRPQKNKPILDVLTQQVSLDTFRDFLFSELSFKSRLWSHPSESNLHQGLTATAMVNDEELRHLLGAYHPAAAALLTPLATQAGLDAEAVQRAIEACADKPVENFDWAFAEGLISSQLVCQWLSRNESAHTRLAALFLSLYLLNQNSLLNAKDFSHCLERLDADRLEELLLHAREKLGLTSAWIAEKLETRLSFPQALPATIEVDPDLLAKFPQGLIRRQMMIPFQDGKQGLGLITSDPFNVALTALIYWITGSWPQVYYAPGGAIIERINRLYARRLTPGSDTPAPEPKPATAPIRVAAPKKASSATVTDLRPARRETELVADNMSAVQLVSSLIESAIEMQTTDIHIEPAKSGMLVRFRIDGELHRIMTIPPALIQSVVSRVKVMAEMDVTERRRPQDGHFELRLDTHNYDFRISTLPAVQGEKIVIRILDEARVQTGLDQLGLMPQQQRLVESMLDQPYGLILVTGPTGSGKTSTLYAGLNILNRENRNLVTIEDPVEYQVEGINQVQVDPHIGLTFSDGLRSILRQDPDVIMVGEIRDADTAHNAIRAAMTGHLVFSTLHTNTALGAIDALVHLGSTPFMVAGSLIGILSQRLLRKLCTACRQPQTTTSTINRQLGLDEKLRKKIFKTAGCDECLKSGYLGRTGVFEVVRVSEPLRPLITQRKLAEVEQIIREQKMPSLAEAAAQKVLDGVTSVDEVLRKVILES